MLTAGEGLLANGGSRGYLQSNMKPLPTGDVLECHMIMALLHVPYMDYYCAYSALRLLV